MKKIIFGILGGFFGFCILNYFPSKRGVRHELDLFIGANCFHIHHWISCLIMLGLLWFGKYYGESEWFDIVCSVIIGFCLEDFLFRNVFNLRNCNR